MTLAAPARERPGWWQRLRRWRESRELARHAIPDRLWRSTLARYPFLALRSESDLAELRRLATLFLARKRFSTAGALRLTDRKAVAVAAQACLPVLRFGLEPYARFVGVVLHPDAVVARREWTDEAGVVHRGSETLAGEAMEGGPVMLSWRDVAGAAQSARWGYNVVIHEFVHALDAYDGVTRGGAGTAEARAWQQALGDEYRRFCDAVEAGTATLDHYGAASPAEFFAVCAEAFFVMPERLAAEEPALYALLQRYFRQDPKADAERARARR